MFDSLSELRLLAGNPLRYRRQILALKQFFAGRRCTVLLLDDLTRRSTTCRCRASRTARCCSSTRCRPSARRGAGCSVTKFRGSDFRGGYHDYAIRRGGLEVYPRLVAAEHRGTLEPRAPAERPRRASTS